MPPILIALNERMRAAAPSLLASFTATEANAIDYSKREGHYLGAHVDDRQLSGPLILNLSLAGDATMTYTHDKSRAMPVRVPLPRRSLQIQAGEVRFSWQHGILNDDLPAERRVSITFRQAPLSGTPKAG
jgi:alkylated DNA repair dioxygenase AlkB